MKIKKQNILINNAGAGFLISSTGVIYSTGAWGCSHQIYYSFSASASLLRIHSLLITISSSSRISLKSVQCEEANSYILSMSTAPVISLLLMISSNNRLRVFSVKYPDDCWLKGSSKDGSETYMIRKGRLSLKLVPPYSTSRKMQAKDISKMKELS